MIFKAITDLSSKADKTYFKEKIDIYIKTVEALCKKYSVELIEHPKEDECVLHIIKMGLIKKKEDMPLLKGVLKKNFYDLFLCAIATEINYSESLSPFMGNLNNSYRKNLQQSERKKKKINLVDLFCGAGGLSLGFTQEGYNTVFANDFDELCIETYKYNHPELSTDKIVCGDIRNIAYTIDQLIEEDVDIVIGGPPCQGFSSANKRHRVIDDPRNELYKYYLEAVEKLAPKIVVMENVKGMLKVANQVVEDYAAIKVMCDGKEYSYQVAYQLLNSADFSVAQSRERLIYIAIRDDIAEKYSVTPADIFNQIETSNKGKPRYNLSAAIEGVRSLEPPHMMNVGELDTEEAGRKIDVNPFVGKENPYLTLINCNREMALVYNHKARYCSEVNHEIYRRLNQGDDATDPKIADIMPYAHRNDKFKDKYYKLYADRPCRTITAHLRSDCHSHIHPTEARTLTPREAARVQSFPDDYLFLGPYLKTYIQIGNAVPVVMAREIAKILKKYLS